MRKLFLLVTLGAQLLVLQAAQECPTLCACVQVGVIDCSFRSLTQVPTDGHVTHARYWNLSNNNLATLGRNSFLAGRHFKSTFMLDLTYNQISYLSENSFSHLTHLGHLKLNHNNITDIGFKDIKADKLYLLDLSHNPHLHLPMHGFPLRHLRVLVMEKCGLTHVPNRFFAKMKNIEILNLSMNKLTILEPHTVAHLDNLIYLDLSGNTFKALPSSLVTHLNVFVHIKLVGNPFHCHCNSRRTYDIYLQHRGNVFLHCIFFNQSNVTTHLSFQHFYQDHCHLNPDSTMSSLSTSLDEGTTDSPSAAKEYEGDVNKSASFNQSQRRSVRTTTMVWLAGTMAGLLAVILLVRVGVAFKRSFDSQESTPLRFSTLRENDEV